MKFKFGVKQIVLCAVAVVLVAVLIAGNIILQTFSPALHAFMADAPAVTPGSGGLNQGETVYDYASRISEESAEDSIVLLKNDDVGGEPYLPLPETAKFNLFGWGATDQGFLLSGGGSGGTNTNADVDGNNVERPRTTLTKAFQEAEIEYNEDLVAAYGALNDFDSDYRDGLAGATNSTDAYKAAFNPGADFYTSERMVNAKNFSEEAIVVLCRWGNENGGASELKNIGSYTDGAFLTLTAEEKVLFDTLETNGFNVTVLLNTTNYIAMGFLDDYPSIKAALYIGCPGQSGAKAIPNLLVGSKLVKDADGGGTSEPISPSGRISDTLANDWKTFAPTYNNVGFGDSIAYREGVYVGYKWYETANAAGLDGYDYDKVVRYPFGYGLAYTTFSQKLKSVTLDGKKVNEGDEISAEGEYIAAVTVTNTGDFPAKDVVQLYYTPEYFEGGIEKASVNLLAFAKTPVIPAGESVDVALAFTAYDLSSYDCYDKNKNGFMGYEIDKGQCDLKLMKNAHELYGTEADCMLSLHSTNGIKIGNDPFTGAEVKNLFTGEDAYGNVPIDGGVEYLSREGKFANYQTAIERISVGQASIVPNYTGYDTEEIAAEVAKYSYGANGNGDMFITTLEDGSAPKAGDLDGTSGAELPVDKLTLRLLIADPVESMWDIMLDALTQDEIKNLIGKGFFGIEPILSIGKPRTTEKDGPSGFNDNTQGGKATCYPFYPTETLLGCSWNIDMMREIGRAQGKVGQEMRLQGWYAPGVNLHRSPFNSRNYEYFSEDGVLSGWLAAGIVNGAKEEGLYCYVKHFALAESGQNSNEWREWTTEQALRENYCKPFELAVKVSIDPDTGLLKKNVRVSYEADRDGEDGKLVTDPNGRIQTGANAMMSAFNCVGAVWSGVNRALLTDMLRVEWGFQGSIITDYVAGPFMKNHKDGLKAGNNIWMDPQKAAANLDFNDPAQAYAARLAVKGILFTYLDTFYTSGLETTVATAPPFSPLFVTLWALIDVVLILGIGACVLFIFWSPKKKSAVGLDADGGSAEKKRDLPSGEA